MRHNLINARIKAGYNKKEIAKLLDITERQYYRLEAGTSDGSLKLWQKLKAILGVSIDELTELFAAVPDNATI